MRVSPFRYLRIAGYLLLPGTFRSLSRLSSAPSAKASSLCSFSHDLFSLRLPPSLPFLKGLSPLRRTGFRSDGGLPLPLRLAWRQGRSFGVVFGCFHAASSDVFPIFRYLRIGFNVEFSRCFFRFRHACASLWAAPLKASPGRTSGSGHGD